jgi:hypothetical protein
MKKEDFLTFSKKLMFENKNIDGTHREMVINTMKEVSEYVEKTIGENNFEKYCTFFGVTDEQPLIERAVLKFEIPDILLFDVSVLPVWNPMDLRPCVTMVISTNFGKDRDSIQAYYPDAPETKKHLGWKNVIYQSLKIIKKQ